MARYIQSGVLIAIVIPFLSVPALSAEVEMRMRGSSQTFTGKLLSFDGSAYVLETELFGEMTFDAGRFECISVDCAKIANEIATGTAPAQAPTADTLSRDRQIELFEGFRDWNDFQTFLEWRRNNQPDQ